MGLRGLWGVYFSKKRKNFFKNAFARGKNKKVLKKGQNEHPA